jgi:hypothetical protein
VGTRTYQTLQTTVLSWYFMLSVLGSSGRVCRQGFVPQEVAPPLSQLSGPNPGMPDPCQGPSHILGWAPHLHTNAASCGSTECPRMEMGHCSLKMPSGLRRVRHSVSSNPQQVHAAACVQVPAFSTACKVCPSFPSTHPWL